MKEQHDKSNNFKSFEAFKRSEMNLTRLRKQLAKLESSKKV